MPAGSIGPARGRCLQGLRRNMYHAGTSRLVCVMERQHLTSSDDDLLGDLRRVVAELDPIPEAVVIAARAAFEWRTLDAELAELIADSAVDEPALLVRGSWHARALAFEAAGLTIELEAEPDADGGLRLAGQLIPPQPAGVTVRHGDDALVAIRADERGRFTAHGVAPGPVRLRCRLDAEAGAARLVETEWMSI
jgi:hypothetical protein